MLQDRIRRFAVAILTAGLLLPAAGTAQDADNETDAAGEEATEQQEQAQKLVQEYRQTAQKLQKIREEAVAANPELEKQSREFEDRIDQAMAEGDYDVEAGREKLQKMGDRFQQEELGQEERQKLASKFQAERQKMQQARQQVMQQEEIRTAGEQLQQDILAAMKEQDSQTETLLQRLRKLRQELRSTQQPGGGASQDG